MIYSACCSEIHLHMQYSFQFSLVSRLRHVLQFFILFLCKVLLDQLTRCNVWLAIVNAHTDWMQVFYCNNYCEMKQLEGSLSKVNEY